MHWYHFKRLRPRTFELWHWDMDCVLMTLNQSYLVWVVAVCHCTFNRSGKKSYVIAHTVVGIITPDVSTVLSEQKSLKIWKYTKPVQCEWKPYRKMSSSPEELHPGNWIPYSERPEWADVTPLPQVWFAKILGGGILQWNLRMTDQVLWFK